MSREPVEPQAEPSEGTAPEPGPAPKERPESEPAALREALGELRRHLERRVGRPRGREQPDLTELFDELRLRLSALGMSERSGEVDEFGLDEISLRRARPLLDLLADRYWRIEVAGLEGVPQDGPCLFVANRSGLLPWDGLMIAHCIARARGEGARPRFLVADWLVTLPFVQPRLARLGGVRACRENAERLLQSGLSVVAFPEGMKGAAKVFRLRYRLQRFGRGGVVRTALVTGAPLVPVAVVGAEEVHPILFRLEAPARRFGLPFLPVTPTFPWLGPLGVLPLPSKWRIRFGTPVPTRDLGAQAAEDDLLVWGMTQRLRETIQGMLEQEIRARESIFG